MASGRAVARMSPGAGVLIYSPTTTYPHGEPLPAVTIVGEITVNEPEPSDVITGGFRGAASLRKIEPLPLTEIREYLLVSRIRFGFCEPDVADAEAIWALGARRAPGHRSADQRGDRRRPVPQPEDRGDPHPQPVPQAGGVLPGRNRASGRGIRCRARLVAGTVGGRYPVPPGVSATKMGRQMAGDVRIGRRPAGWLAPPAADL